MYEILDWLAPFLPENKPRHFLGIGDFQSIIQAVLKGVDIFDCVAPTREAGNGRLYTHDGFLHITNANFKKDAKPIEDDCRCYACRKFSRGYINHLLRSREMLGMRLATIHNINFMNEFFKDIRENIENLAEWGEDFLKRFNSLS